MESKFSDRVKDTISFSREEAIRLGHDYIGPEHLLLGLIRQGEGGAIHLLVNLGVDLSQLKRSIENAIKTSNPFDLNQIPITRQAEKVLKVTRLEAKLLNNAIIDTQHLLLSILREENNVAAQILSRFGVSYDVIRAETETTLQAPADLPDQLLSASSTGHQVNLSLPGGTTVAGISLGTTNACVSLMEGNEPQVIVNAEGKRKTPSMVAFTRDGERVVGEQAKRQALARPQNTIKSIQRFLGKTLSESSDEGVNLGYTILEGRNDQPAIKIGDKTFSPQEITAIILQKMNKTANDHLGKEVKEVVISVPVSFTDKQRNATREAGEIAGFKVKAIIKNPIAASLAYGLDKRNEHLKIAVFDLGGETFNIIILEWGDGIFEILTNGVNNKLGGEDFDKLIMNWLILEFKQEHNMDLSSDLKAMQRLKEAAETAKIELSSMAKSEINLPYIFMDAEGPKHLERTLSREHFEFLAKPLFEDIQHNCFQTLEMANLSAQNIDEVILVGGSSFIPMIQTIVREIFRRDPLKSINPDEVVAQGACLLGTRNEQKQARSEMKIAKWHKTVGQEIKKNEVLLSIDNQQGTIKWGSPSSGKLESISIQAGEQVKSGEVVARLGTFLIQSNTAIINNPDNFIQIHVNDDRFNRNRIAWPGFSGSHKIESEFYSKEVPTHMISEVLKSLTDNLETYSRKQISLTEQLKSLKNQLKNHDRNPDIAQKIELYTAEIKRLKTVIQKTKEEQAILLKRSNEITEKNERILAPDSLPEELLYPQYLTLELQKYSQTNQGKTHASQFSDFFQHPREMERLFKLVEENKSTRSQTDMYGDQNKLHPFGYLHLSLFYLEDALQKGNYKTVEKLMNKLSVGLDQLFLSKQYAKIVEVLNSLDLINEVIGEQKALKFKNQLLALFSIVNEDIDGTMKVIETVAEEIRNCLAPGTRLLCKTNIFSHGYRDYFEYKPHETLLDLSKKIKEKYSEEIQDYINKTQKKHKPLTDVKLVFYSDSPQAIESSKPLSDSFLLKSIPEGEIEGVSWYPDSENEDYLIPSNIHPWVLSNYAGPRILESSGELEGFQALRNYQRVIDFFDPQPIEITQLPVLNLQQTIISRHNRHINTILNLNSNFPKTDPTSIIEQSVSLRTLTKISAEILLKSLKEYLTNLDSETSREIIEIIDNYLEQNRDIIDIICELLTNYTPFLKNNNPFST